MITTIYNLINLIFTSYLAYIGDFLSLKIYYTLLCVGAIFIAYRIDLVVSRYPEITPYYKDGVEHLFGEEFKSRLSNYIGSYLCHLVIIVYMMQNIALTIAITAVFIFRTILLVIGNKKIKKEFTKND